ncbi:flagellar hook-length control protein FliK, partial [Bordetella petrii]|nr:flagellar hook-length control protein FliK [Bordetella petrii]
MSVGPSALGTVLVQRLDAVLGTTMAAHANLISGARPNAVAQPGETVRPGQTDPTGRNPRTPVDAAGPRGERGTTVADTKTAEAQGQAARNLVTRSDTTASAPTTLGQTARTILALLALYPEQAPPAQGKVPLWQPATA